MKYPYTGYEVVSTSQAGKEKKRLLTHFGAAKALYQQWAETSPLTSLYRVIFLGPGASSKKLITHS